MVIFSQESENRAVRGVFAAIWAWGGSDECSACHSSAFQNCFSVLPKGAFFQVEAVSLSFQSAGTLLSVYSGRLVRSLFWLSLVGKAFW